MNGISLLAERIRSAAEKSRADEPLAADEATALRDALAALPADLAEEDESALLGAVSRARRNRLLGRLSAAASVIIALGVWYAVTGPERNGEPIEVAALGPELEIKLTPPPRQALVLRPDKAESLKKEDSIVDLGKDRFGEIRVTPKQDCVVFVTFLGANPEGVMHRSEEFPAQRVVRKDSKQYFGFEVPENVVSGTFVVLASRGPRDLEELARDVLKRFEPTARAEAGNIARILERLREYSGLSVRTARFRRTRE